MERFCSGSRVSRDGTALQKGTCAKSLLLRKILAPVHRCCVLRLFETKEHYDVLIARGGAVAAKLGEVMSSIRTSVPCFGLLTTLMVPPRPSTMFLTMARPRPVPPGLVVK